MERSAQALMHRFVVIAADVLIVLGAYLGALLLRFGGDVPETYWSRAEIFIPAAAVAHVVVNSVFGAYSNDSIVHRAAFAGLFTAVLVFVVNLSLLSLPLSVVLFGELVSLLGFVVVRLSTRAWGGNPDGEAVTGTIDS